MLNPRDYYEQLDRITKNNGESISFYYTNNAETRLKLDSLSISAPGSNEQRYKMTYDSESLPRYNSRKTDVWGYYNYEDPYNPTLRNSTDVDTFVACISRQRAEMLKKIEYPTGGWTTFEYEPHDYSQVVNQLSFTLEPLIKQAGGLRVKIITDYAPGQQINKRTFHYTGESGQSSGILSGRPQFYTSNPENAQRPDFFKSLFNTNDYLFYVFFSENTFIQLFKFRK